MPTALSTPVVVATVVNTSMSEAAFRQHVVEQLRTNDRSLLEKLVDVDTDANVVTAVLNVEELLEYLIRRFPKVVSASHSTGEMPDSTAPTERIEADAVTAEMSEGEFMDYVLRQLEAGEIEPLFRISDEEWQKADDEPIGEHFSLYPFLY